MDTSKLDAKIKEIIDNKNINATDGNNRNNNTTGGNKKSVMYGEKIEALIDIALEDGILSYTEEQLLLKKAREAGIDADEFKMVLDARLAKMRKENKNSTVQNFKSENHESKNEKQGKSSSPLKKIGIGIVLVIALGVAGYFLYQDHKSTNEEREKAEVAIRNNDLSAAFDIMKGNGSVKKDLADPFLRKCFELNDFGKAESLYNSLDKYEKKCTRSIVQEKVEALIIDNDLTNAYNLMKNDAQIMDNVTELYIRKCYELNEAGKSDLFNNSLQKAAEAAIRDEDLTTAYSIMKKNTQIMDNLTELYIRKCLELNEFDETDLFYNSLAKGKKESVRSIIYDYYMQHNNYEKTEKYTKFYSEPNPNSIQHIEEHYAYIVDVVTSMCKAGKKEEAKSYAKGLIEKYEWQEKQFFKDNKYSKEGVTESITEFINNY